MSDDLTADDLRAMLDQEEAPLRATIARLTRELAEAQRDRDEYRDAFRRYVEALATARARIAELEGDKDHLRNTIRAWQDLMAEIEARTKQVLKGVPPRTALSPSRDENGDDR